MASGASSPGGDRADPGTCTSTNGCSTIHHGGSGEAVLFESDFMSSTGYLRRVAADLAPTGNLRVALNMGLVTLVTKDPGTGELRGVAVELGRELGGSLKIPFVPVEYSGVAGIVGDVKANKWDVAFLAVSAGGAVAMDLSPAFMDVDYTYLVPAGSRITTVADADQAGVRIAVQNRSGSDVYLTPALKHAEPVRAATLGDAFEAPQNGQGRRRGHGPRSVDAVL